jgi:hypothetical protein
MSDHERMLAEGPRVAPEPRIAEAEVAGAPETAEARTAAGAGATQASVWLRRVVPLAIFAVFVLASEVGVGAYAELLFVALVGIAVVVGLLKGAFR